MEDYKTCSMCSETKPVSEWSKNRSKKDGLQGHCTACLRAYRQANREKEAARSRAYRQANREKEAARRRAYYQANREKVNAKNRAYRQANREKMAAYNRAYYHANPEKVVAWNRAYEQANAEKVAASKRAYRQANPERNRAAVERRRARKAGNGVYLILPKELKRLYASPCVACGVTENIQLDHIIPLKRGGPTSIGNSQPLCRSCNASKHDKLMIEWRAA